MKLIPYISLILVLLSCGNEDSELYLILRDENKELFDKNNELVKSIDEKNQLIQMKIDSMETKQLEIIKSFDEKIMKIQKDDDEGTKEVTQTVNA